MALKQMREARYNDAKEVMLSYNAESMAKALGCSLVTYYKKEADPNNNLTMTEAKALGELLGCPPQALYSSKTV